MAVVREIQCRTVLNRSSISDYSLNCYTGCTHGCVYCYARFMQRFHPHSEPWGEFVDVKVNAVEALERQLGAGAKEPSLIPEAAEGRVRPRRPAGRGGRPGRAAPPGDVFVSSACDGWQPIERRRQLTRRACQVLLDHGFQVNVLTKSALVLRDLDILAGRAARVGVTITTLDHRLARLWEPRAAPVADRLRVLAEAKRAGLATAVMFGPLLPFLSDDEASLDRLFERAGDLAVDVIWVDALNPRPRVWPAVAALLRRHFPGLRDRYSRMLFEGSSREAYLNDLRERVARAAERRRLAERLAGCP